MYARLATLKSFLTGTPHPWMGALIVLVGSICYSSKAIFVKLAYPYGVDVLSLLALRMAFSVPFFLIVAFGRKPTKAATLRPKTLGAVVLVGIFGYYLAAWLDFSGLQFVPAGIERLILFAYPTLVVLINRLFLGKTMTLRQAGALLLTYTGIGIVMLGDGQMAKTPNLLLGGGLIFLAALCYAVYLVGGQQLTVELGVRRFTALAMLGAALAVAIHSVIDGNVNLLSLPRPVYVYTAWMAIIATVLPSFMIVYGLRQIGASTTAIIASVGPVSTIVLAYIFLGEVLSWGQWMGTAVVMAGVLLISARKRSAPTPQD